MTSAFQYTKLLISFSSEFLTMLIKIKAFIYLDTFHYRYMKVDFLQGGSDRQEKEALPMEMVHVLYIEKVVVYKIYTFSPSIAIIWPEKACVTYLGVSFWSISAKLLNEHQFTCVL